MDPINDITENENNQPCIEKLVFPENQEFWWPQLQVTFPKTS